MEEQVVMHLVKKITIQVVVQEMLHLVVILVLMVVIAFLVHPLLTL